MNSIGVTGQWAVKFDFMKVKSTLTQKSSQPGVVKNNILIIE